MIREPKRAAFVALVLLGFGGENLRSNVPGPPAAVTGHEGLDTTSLKSRSTGLFKGPGMIPMARTIRRDKRVSPQSLVTLEPLEGRTLFSGFNATFYDSPNFTGREVSRVDSTIDFDWGTAAPTKGIKADTFSASWTGQVIPSFSERYTFDLKADDGARLWVNGQLIVDAWRPTDGFNHSGAITLIANQVYDLRLDYREDAGPAQVKLSWSSKSQVKQVVPAAVVDPLALRQPPIMIAAGISSNGVNSAVAAAVADVANFGARGNGIYDDAPAIQRAIDSLAPGGTLRLSDKTYRLNKGLVINKPLTVEGNNANLLLNTSAAPQNNTIAVRSSLTNISSQWIEPVTAGQSVFHPTSPDQFKVGDWVFLELGQDPDDKNQQHFTSLAKVTANAGGAVTLDVTVPYNIAAGQKPNRITTVDHLATDVTIKDLRFDHVKGTISDAEILVQRARNVSITSVSGRFNAVLLAADSKNVSLRGVNATLTKDHPAAGRVLTAWQSDNVQVSDVKASTAYDMPVFFLESWTRNTQISNVDVDWQLKTATKNSIFHLAGDSYNTTVDKLRIHNPASVVLVASGSQKAKYTFGTVSIDGPVVSAPLSVISDLTIGTNHYANPVHTTINVDLAGGWSDHSVPLVAGTIKSIKITASNTKALTKLYVLNASAAGGDVLKSLVSGQAVALDSFGSIGSDYRFNDMDNSRKRLAVYTPASVPAGSRLTVDIEYYPPK